MTQYWQLTSSSNAIPLYDKCQGWIINFRKSILCVIVDLCDACFPKPRGVLIGEFRFSKLDMESLISNPKRNIFVNSLGFRNTIVHVEGQIKFTTSLFSLFPS